MSGANRAKRLKRVGGTIVLAAAGVVGISDPCVGHAYASARGFGAYFRSIEKSTLQHGLWERVALSLVLASANSPEPVCANKARKRPPSL